MRVNRRPGGFAVVACVIQNDGCQGGYRADNAVLQDTPFHQLEKVQTVLGFLLDEAEREHPSLELFALLSAGDVVGLGYTGFEKYSALLFGVGRDVGEEEVEECC